MMATSVATASAVLVTTGCIYLALTRLPLRRVQSVPTVALPKNLSIQKRAFTRLALIEAYYTQFNLRHVNKGEKYDFKIVSGDVTEDLSNLESGKIQTVVYDLHHWYTGRLIVTKAVERKYMLVWNGNDFMTGMMSDEFVMLGTKVKWEFSVKDGEVGGKMFLDGPAWVILLCGPFIRKSLIRRLGWIREDAENDAGN